MKDNINVEVIKAGKTSLFCNYIFKAIPLAFDESMSYYECLCGLLNYLKNTIIPTVNNNADAVAELQELFTKLQNFVNNYFDNLDVQDEINNKLDEMVKDGTFENILANYSNITRVYNTHQDLVNDANALVNNMKVKTLGYYEINDGGGAEYYITDTLDETKYQEKVNDLYAELIIKDGKININSLGADSTGVNDSSTIFNKAFEFINNKWLNNDYGINTIVCNGTYLWNNQVKMPPCARLRCNGYTTILTNVPNDSALFLSYLDSQLPSNFPGNKQDWNYAELINFDKGGILKNIGEKTNSKCIEIGTRTNLNELHSLSRYKICNFRIYNYDIGVLHNIYNVYIGKYECISFENNTIGVQYGVENKTVTNSGENMVYEQCLFASENNAINWLCDGFDSSFTNCSFDFLQDIFLDVNNHGYKRISLINCHIESFTSIMNDVPRNTIIDINNSNIVDSKRGKYFSTAKLYSLVNMSNNNINPISANVYNPEKIYHYINFALNLSNNRIGNDEIYLGFIGYNNKLGLCFDNIEDGEVNVTTNAKIGNFTVKSMNDTLINTKGRIVTDNYLYKGHKSLVLKSNSENTASKNFNIETDFIPISNEKKIYTNAFTYNIMSSCNIAVSQFDINKNLIVKSDNYHHGNPAITNRNEWYSSSYGKSINIRSNCAFIKIEYQFPNINGSNADPITTEYKIGGMCCN